MQQLITAIHTKMGSAFLLFQLILLPYEESGQQLFDEQGLNGSGPTKYSCICSIHFTEDCFEPLSDAAREGNVLCSHFYAVYYS